jgi:hypothetical protein
MRELGVGHTQGLGRIVGGHYDDDFRFATTRNW